MFSVQDHLFMQRCMHLALKGAGRVSPNPLVGAVIVHHNKIIGEGWHAVYGGPHAEVQAVQSVSNRALLTESTLYVNLEPCNHKGKTPPCTSLIISCKIPRVVIAMRDPSPKVNGAGIKKLQEEGVEVRTGLCENEATFLNRRFVTAHQYHRPYIKLKWAESADGFTGRKNESVRISNSLSNLLTHLWRSEEQGILTGGHTIAVDNPHLTVREVPGPSPVRIIIDSRGGLNPASHVFNNQVRTIVFSTNDQAYPNCEFIPFDATKNKTRQVCEALFMMGIHSVLVEGGAQTLREFIEADLWDEATIFRSPVKLYNGLPAPQTGCKPLSITEVGDNQLLHYFRGSV